MADGAVAAATSCLPGAVPLAERRNVSVEDLSVALNLVEGDWDSSSLATQIFSILVAEKLGYNVTITRLVTSRSLLYALAGCTMWDNIPDCSSRRASLYHLSFEYWPTLDYEEIKKSYPEILPTHLGAVGYVGKEGIFVMGSVLDAAMNSEGLPLDFYKSYNTTFNNPATYFAGQQDYDPSKFRPCNVSNGQASDHLLLSKYLKSTGDDDGLIRKSDGTFTLKCFNDNRWFRTPACRKKPHSCVPLVTGGNGWALQFLLTVTTAAGMPVQIAVASNWSSYRTTPLLGKTSLVYWWMPDPTFLELDPLPIIFPPHDKTEWQEGLQRTNFPAHDLWKLGSVGIHTLAPRAAAMAKAFQLTDKDMTEVLLNKKTSGSNSSEVACEWLREHKAIWKDWIPRPTACGAGDGLVDDAEQFVENEANAISCLRCSPGRFSSVDGDVRTCQGCPAGRFGNAFRATECKSCPAGTFSQKQNATSFSKNTGNVECARCPTGRFQPATTSSTCISCEVELINSQTAFQGATVASECQCAPGTYRLRREETVLQECVSCGEGLVCPGGMQPPQQDAKFFARTVRYRTNGSSSDGLAVLEAEPSMIRCESAEKCTFGADLGSCPRYLHRLACDDCEGGFMWNGQGCVECTGYDFLPLLFIFAGGVMIAICICFLVTSPSRTFSLDFLTVSIAVSLIINTIQSLGAVSDFSIEWIEPMATLEGILDLATFSVRVVKPTCLMVTSLPEVSYMGSLLVYPCFSLLLILVLAIFRLVLHRPVQRHHVINAEGISMLIFYLTLASQALVPFHCVSNPDGSSSVSSGRSILCWDSGSGHKTMIAFSVLAILAFIVLPLVLLIHVTIQYPKRVVDVGGRQFFESFRFLFNRYTEKSYFYGIVFMMKNIGIAVIPVLFVDFPVLQVSCTHSLVASTLTIQCWLQPWRTQYANRLDTVAGLMTISVLVCAAMLVPISSRSDSTILQVSLSVILSLCFVLLITPGFHLVRKKCLQGKRFGVFVSHHKSEAAVLARLWKVLLEAEMQIEVYLDSDNLVQLDSLFDTVGNDTEYLLLLLTNFTLERPWCAGEIATAVHKNVNIIPVACDGFQLPSTEALLEIPTRWSAADVTMLASRGVSVDAITAAYEHLSCLPVIRFDRSAGEEKRWMALREVIGECKSPSKINHRCLKSLASKPKTDSGKIIHSYLSLVASTRDVSSQALTAVWGSTGKGDNMDACLLLQLLLSRHSKREVALYSGHRDNTDYRSRFDKVKCIVVMLTPGILSDLQFAKIITLVTSKDEILILPVLGSLHFKYPDSSFYDDLVSGKCFQPTDFDRGQLKRLRAAYSKLFSSIAARFSPEASKVILNAEIAVIAKRVEQATSEEGNVSFPASAQQEVRAAAAPTPPSEPTTPPSAPAASPSELTAAAAAPPHPPPPYPEAADPPHSHPPSPYPPFLFPSAEAAASSPSDLTSL